MNNIIPKKIESSKRVYVVSTEDYDYDEQREMTIVAESKEKAEEILPLLHKLLAE